MHRAIDPSKDRVTFFSEPDEPLKSSMVNLDIGDTWDGKRTPIARPFSVLFFASRLALSCCRCYSESPLFEPFRQAVRFFSLVFDGVRFCSKRLVEHTGFNNFMFLCILLNSVVLAMDSPVENYVAHQNEILKFCNEIFTLVFFFEAVTKLSAFGTRQYFAEKW